MQPTAETRTAFIRIDEEGILYLTIKDKVLCNEQDVGEVFDVYRKWGCDKKKVLQITQAKSFFLMDINSQKYISKHGKDFFIASAIINRTLRIRIMFNFFNRIFKHGVPFRMFPDEKSALQWLRTFKEGNQ